MKKMKADNASMKTDNENLNPGKIDPKKWQNWFESFMNYLRSLTGVLSIPLSYVCRDDNLEVNEPQDDTKILEYQAPLEGNAYSEDNC